MKIYLDYAATTPLDSRVKKAMDPYFSSIFGNPSSIHFFGQEALKAVDQSRAQIAGFFKCQPHEVIFTSGATESNNLALKGVIYAHQNAFHKPHLITSQIEHPCIMETAKWLEKQGLAEVTYLPINKQGLIEIKTLAKAVKKNTVLVSVMYVNNEIGTIQPISEIKKYTRALVHTDAVQAVNYLDCDIRRLGVDLLSFSGHKIYGPKGIGALIVKKGVKISRIQEGGAQENGLRAGTLNVPAIIGLGAAIKLISVKESLRIKKLRDYLWSNLSKAIADIELNGSLAQRVPNNLNISFNKVEGEGILMSLDLEGIAVSSGSACASASLSASPVIMALTHNNHLRTHASIRFTLGRQTTKTEITHLIKTLPPIIKRLRKISPY